MDSKWALVADLFDAQGAAPRGRITKEDLNLLLEPTEDINEPEPILT